MSHPPSLSEIADFLYDACELYEDDDLDAEDTLAVIKAAYLSSDCDDFAYVLHRMTAWQVVQVTWTIPAHGFGHHMLLQAPDGRLVDVSGWTDEAALARRYGWDDTCEVRYKDIPSVKVCGLNLGEDIDDEGRDEAMVRVAAVIRQLPYEPFATTEMQQITQKPVAGVDLPLPSEDQAAAKPDSSGARGP